MQVYKLDMRDKLLAVPLLLFGFIDAKQDPKLLQNSKTKVKRELDQYLLRD